MIKVELYKDLAGTPKKIFVKRNQIPAANRGVLKNVRGINVVRIHDGHIIQVAGYNLRDGLYCYLTKPDGSLARSF